MSKYPFFLPSMPLPLATLLVAALTMTPRTQVLAGEAARFDGFTQADGGNVFALTLKPRVPAVNGPRDVVVAPRAGQVRPSAAIPTTRRPAPIKEAIARNAGGSTAPVAPASKPESTPTVAEGDLILQGDGAALPPDGVAAEKELSESAALEEQWQKDVQSTINKARSLVMVDPARLERRFRMRSAI